MRTLLTTTALVALMSAGGGAMAQDAATPAGGGLLNQGYEVVDTDALASRLIGFPVYTSAMADAEKLGEINDIVLGDDGAIGAVILGVGGFLGIGEKKVAVDYGQLEWTVAEDNTERLVLGVTREQLETATAVEYVDDDPRLDTAATNPAAQPADRMAPADPMQPAATDTAQAPADPANPAKDDAMAVDESMETAEAGPEVDESLETGTIRSNDPAANDDAMQSFNRESLVDLDEMALTAEELIGINVYGPADEHIGVIGDFVLGTDDTVDAIIIDFGGFLGIGVKQVAIGYDNLQFYSDETGTNRYLTLNVTREMMEQAPEFDSETYAEQRDNQRLVLDGNVAAN